MATPPPSPIRLADVSPDPAYDAARFWAKVDKSGECWTWTAYKLSTGYGRFGIGWTAVWQAHRYSALMHFGEIPAGALVLHTCDTPACVRPEHLYFGTNADNNRDMSDRERFNYGVLRGSNNQQSKLSAEQVLEIRRKCAGGQSRRSLGREYGVSHQTVSDIVARRLWDWL